MDRHALTPATAIATEVIDDQEEIAPMSMAFDPIHPGDVLAEQIEALGITAAEAARALGIRRAECHRSSIAAVQSRPTPPFVSVAG